MSTTSLSLTQGGPPRASREPLFYLLAVLVFLAASGLTLYFCRSMGDGMDMAMPGGWTMSMMWMPMPGQPWVASVAMFLAMWLAMMIAMMLPSTLPMLVLYRRLLAFRGQSAAAQTVLMACGYFFVWLVFGAVAYAGGASIAWATMRWPAVSRAVPAASGLALISCGVFQFTHWKSSCLRHCRDPLSLVADHACGGMSDGWRLGIHHGVFCAACCWGLMLIQLVLGVMSLTAMIAVAAVIAMEKLIPRADVVVRLTGAGAVIFGIILTIKAGL